MGKGGITHSFVTAALTELEWSASLPDRFTPEERATGIHGMGNGEGHTAGSDVRTREGS